MKPRRLLPLLAGTAACALGAVSVPAAGAATAPISQASSENWAGYVVGGSSQDSPTNFKSVSGSWVQPTATCTGSSSYSAFWVGIGGAGSQEALEQDGTEANCGASGQVSYYAWYELVPSAPVRIDLAVHPGDHMSSKVTVNGTEVDMTVSNQTTGQSFSKTVHMDNPDTSSAEWIAEAPSECDSSASSCSPLPLTNFGTVKFTSASATSVGGHTGGISDPDWSASAVTLSPSAGSLGFQGVSLDSGSGTGSATPSALSSDGSSFSVAYGDPGYGGSGYGYGDPGSGDGYGDPGWGYGGGGAWSDGGWQVVIG